MNVNSGLNELAQLEVTKTKIMLVISSIVSSILFMIGVYLVFKKNNYKQTLGKVLSVNSCYNTQPISCLIGVSYDVNNQSYSNNVNLNLSPKVGDMVSIEYDVSNPINIRNPQMKLIYLGFILIGIALFFVGISYYNYYMSSRSRIYAATTGAIDVSNLVRKIF
jgi:multisubunit Na+/H+ antiporter MnhC subunit